jgi:hypothetical protein
MQTLLTCAKHRIQKQNMSFSYIHWQFVVYELDADGVL